MGDNNKHHGKPGNHQRLLWEPKFTTLEEIDKFLNTYNHWKLNQEDINHLNRSITQNEVEAARVSQKRKVQDLMDSLLNSFRPLKKN
jgi:hypothetical protein